MVNAPGAERREAPVGVFDSGIGGLTVARAILHRLPDESLLYFGDTARVPYGPKSPATVERYAREITTFLLEQGVKAIVVACNTATAHALPVLIAESPVPVIGVVEPGARAAAAVAPHGSVGVIGTVGTIASGAYDRAILALAPDARVVTRACPLFVPLVEEGWTEHAATRLIAHDYLDGFAADRLDALVLGCTHYPLLTPLLAEVMGAGTQLIDSAEETAIELMQRLDTGGLRAPAGSAVVHRFIASDAPDQMLRLGQRFLGAPIDRVDRVVLG